MSREYRNDFRRLLLGLFPAVLALLGQIALGVVIPGQTARTTPAVFADGFPICHSAPPDTPGSNTPVRDDQHGMDCALCRVCSALSAATFLPVPAPQSPAPPVALVTRQTPHPPARGPPAVVFAAAYPTGPPSLT
jgi:hypothetical protein